MIASRKLTLAQRVYLDFVRALAALLVCFGHASMVFLQGGWLEKSALQVGAVPVFFLLSGFLISCSVFQKYGDHAYHFRDYFFDRFCRIYCAFFPALLFVAFADHFALNADFYAPIRAQYDIQTFFGNLLMLQDFPIFQFLRRAGMQDNKWFIDVFGSAGPFWTISIEWWIYMLFGGVVFFRIRSVKPVPLWGWALLAFAAIEPVYHFVGGPDQCLTMLWVLGMAGCFVFMNLPVWVAKGTITSAYWRRACLIAGLGALGLLGLHFIVNKYHNGGNLITDFQSGIYIAVALFAFLFALGTVNHVPDWIATLAHFIAEYSYSLYLTHVSLYMLLRVFASNDSYNPRLFVIAIITAQLVAIAFWWLFERHHRAAALWLRDIFSKSSQTMPTTVR